MKGTKRTSVIAIALALVLALSVLVGAGIAPAVNEEGNAPVDNGQITFDVKCQHGEDVSDAAITGTATYTLVTSEEPEPSAEPSAEPSEQPVEPSAPAEPSAEPSEQPVEPSVVPVEPSEQPVEPSEQPVEPSAPIVEPEKTITKDFTGTVDKATTENGYNYTLASLKYTVTAKGYETKSEAKDIAEITDDAITVVITDIAPTMDVEWTNATITIDAKDSYGKGMYILLFNDLRAIDAKNGQKFPDYIEIDESNEQDSIIKAFADYGKFESDSDKTPTAYIKDYSTAQSFYRVDMAQNDRLIAVVDSHGNVTSKIVHKYFSVEIPEEYSNSKTATITVNGSLIISKEIGNDKINNYRIVLKQKLENNEYKAVKVYEETTPILGRPLYKDKVSLRNESYEFYADINNDGEYTIQLLKTGEKGDIVVTSYNFTVSKIDTTAPELTVDETGSVINHITGTATDEGGSGVAGVYLAQVEFGYVQAKNADGSNKVKEISVKTGEKDEAGNDITATVKVNVYQGTINGVAVGDEYDSTPNGTAQIDIDNANADSMKKAKNAAKDFFDNDKSDLPKDVVKGVNDNKISATLDNSNGNYEFSLDALEKAFNGQSPALIIWATDNAGNVSKIAKLGAATDAGNKITIDCDNPVVEGVKVGIITNEEGNEAFSEFADGEYSNSKTVTVKATVVEPNIKSITAYLMKDNESSGNVTFAVDSDKRVDAGTDTYEYTAAFTFRAAEDDGENYYVVVVAEDAAGNKSYTTEGEVITPNQDNNANSISFTIDTIDPQLKDGILQISLVEEGKTQNKTNDSDYYGGDAKITFTVDELHFASGKLYYTKDSNEAEPITVELDKDGAFSYTFNPDGVYQLNKLVLTDKAGNTYTYWLDKTKASGEHEGELEQAEFKIDHILPTISVKYNNNDVRNDKYFNAERTATITVIETNFKESTYWWDKVDKNSEMESGVYIVCSKNGNEVTNKPADLDPSNWTTDGDHHTMTIKYDPDANYTFDVYVVDKAGNYTAYEKKATEDAVSPTDFTVDKTKPTITVTGITNGSAYNGEVAGTVEFNDVNFNGGTIKLTRADKNSVYDVTAQHVGALPVRGNGGSVSIANFDRLLTNDGIYTLSVTAIDMAGNEADPVTVTFSVNRFGSTYKFDDYLASICDNHIKSVTSDLKITEINPDSITNGTVTITRNGKVIDSGDIAPALQRSASASGGWYEYLYTISKDLFKEDGMYKIVVSSKDAAGNEPNSENDDDFEIVFWVDDTPAEISGIQGLEEAIINAENHTVKFTVRDNIGLKSVTVYCDDKEIAKFGENDFTAGDLVDAEFTISEASSAQHIRIVAEDLSGNVLDTDGSIEGSANTDITFERDVTVSTNFFVRWFANKPLFFGSIAVIVAAGVGIYFIVAKKHKKEETTAE